MKTTYLTLSILCLSISCSTPNGALTDIDGITYQTKMFDNDIWMIENLAVTKNRDGETIKYYYPNSDPNNKDAFGLLYDYETALQVCPTGWRLPTNDEWDRLLQSHKMKSAPYQDTEFWSNASNTTSFSAKPTGYGNNGEYDNFFGSKVYFLTGTKTTEEFVWTYIFEKDSIKVRTAEQHPTYAYAVRCIKDKSD